MVLIDFIKDDCIPEGDDQVTSGSACLPAPVTLEKEDQSLERVQNECDHLETLGEYKCDTRMFPSAMSCMYYTKARAALCCIMESKVGHGRPTPQDTKQTSYPGLHLFT